LLGKKLKNPEFRKEWEAQKEEFEVAKEVIRLRIKAGITQKELAEKAYTSQPAIAVWNRQLSKFELIVSTQDR